MILLLLLHLFNRRRYHLSDHILTGKLIGMWPVRLTVSGKDDLSYRFPRRVLTVAHRRKISSGLFSIGQLFIPAQQIICKHAHCVHYFCLNEIDIGLIEGTER